MSEVLYLRASLVGFFVVERVYLLRKVLKPGRIALVNLPFIPAALTCEVLGDLTDVLVGCSSVVVPDLGLGLDKLPNHGLELVFKLS